MTGFTVYRRSLRFYWRTHVSIVLGAAVAAMVLTGALLVGDSMRYSLRRIADQRLGRIESAMMVRGRTFGGLAQWGLSLIHI